MKTGADHPAVADERNDRYRLPDEPLDLGGGLLAGTVLDQLTHRSFSLWFVPPGLAARPESAAALEARVAASICINDRRLLKTYGMHLTAGGRAVRVEMSQEPRLMAPGSAHDLRTAKLSSTIAWLHDVAVVLDKTGADFHLPHGAVSPFWIRTSADGTPRLDGISFAAPFADAGAGRAEEAWFSSPARRRGEEPGVADDVFGIAALAFWAMAGGGSPDEMPREGIQPGAIDKLRRTHGLPPTGWQRGWDQPIVAGLSATPSLRPGSATAITGQLQTLLPAPPSDSTARSPVRTPRTRQLPPWRGALQRNGDRNVSHSGLEVDVANARQALDADIRANATQRTKLETDMAAVARSRNEVESTRQKLEAADQELIQRLHELQEKEHRLKEREQAAGAAGAKAESIIAREAAVTAREQQLESEDDQLRRNRDQLDRSIRDSIETQERLKVRQQELEATEKELAVRHRQFTVEQQKLEKAGETLESESRTFRVEQERLREREAAVAQNEASFATREEEVATREEEVARTMAEFASTRETLAAERAEINRLLLENKSIVDEAKRAESRVEEVRAEGARIEKELAARRAELADYEQAVRQREVALNERDAALQQRAENTARKEALFEEVGLGLQAAGEGTTEPDKLIVEVLGLRRNLDEREKSLAVQTTQLEQGKADLATAIRENDRERSEIADKHQQVELERAATIEKTQRLAQDRQSWEATKHEQENDLAHRATEADARNATLLLRGAVQNVLAQTADPPRPTPPTAPLPKRSSSRLWPAVAIASLAALSVLAFLFFQASDDNDRLRRTADDVTKRNALIVVTDPAGANVSIGNKPPVPAPAKFENLPPGNVQVLVKKDGYRDETRTVVVKPGETVVTDPIVLGPIVIESVGRGALLIQTDPSGAEVGIVGSNAPPERSPVLFKNLPEGSISFTMRLAGYQLERREAVVRSNRTTVVDHTLKPIAPPPTVGGLSISTDPDDAMVEIGGKPAQRTPGRPVTVQNLAPGPVKVTVKQNGFETAERTFQLEAGRTESQTIVLRRIPPPITPPAKAAPPPLPLPPEFRIEATLPAAMRMVRIDPREVNISPDSNRMRITRPFLIGTTEVTQTQFQSITLRNPSARFEKRTRGPDKAVKRPPRFEMRGGAQVPVPQPDEIIRGEETVQPYPNHPVENVTWEDAMEFCRALTEREKDRIPAGAVFRLPTETEWWCAATSSSVSSVSGWFSEYARGEHRDVPVRVPTDRSIDDMFGNVSEWCLDAWHDKLPESGSNDPLTLDEPLRRLLGSTVEKYRVREATGSAGRRVVTGGSFQDPTGRMFRKSGEGRAAEVGFRIVLGHPAGTPKE